MQDVASQLDIHPVEVYGVVTFYSFLSTELKGKYIIRLCRTISCDLAGKKAIAATIERELGLIFDIPPKTGDTLSNIAVALVCVTKA